MKVVLLTQEGCALCDQAKAMLARLAREFPLDVSDVPFYTPEGQELAEQGGIFFPPGIFVDGRPFCYGQPSEQALRREFVRCQAAEQ